MKNFGIILLIISFSLAMAGCIHQGPDVSGIRVQAEARRFERDLFAEPGPDVPLLRSRYGGFFDVFAHRVISIPEGPDSMVASSLAYFVNDNEVRDIYRLTDSAYSRLDDVEAGMETFLKHLVYYYPGKPVPEVITFISAFNYAVITTDSVIGIGLDMFLGNEVAYYPRLGIPRYMFTNFRREYIVPSAIKAWFQSEYDPAEVKKEFLSQMIYQGKLLYYIKAMAPSLHDSLVTGYTLKQLEWCEKNESNIWSFFIEKKMLFSTDISQFAKFINEGPSTSGFGDDAPGKLGAWVGWQIVNRYAEQMDGISLQDILDENDAQKILEQSRYKPRK